MLHPLIVDTVISYRRYIRNTLLSTPLVTTFECLPREQRVRDVKKGRAGREPRQLLVLPFCFSGFFFLPILAQRSSSDSLVKSESEMFVLYSQLSKNT